MDVAVLGGGPAGCAAARLLALQGHSVVLLTRPPAGPPLAESLTPSCARLLARLGVLEAMSGAPFVRSTGHTVRWGTSEARVELFAGGERGWQVRRDVLDRLLLRKAGEAGAVLHRHASVRGVRAAGDLHRVTYEERRRLQTTLARWVIDCTGRSGLMSRRGSGRRAPGPRTMAIVGAWERRPSWQLQDESHTLVESYPGGWAWSVPLTRTRRQVTVMLDPSRTPVAAGTRLRRTYRDELARTTMLRLACSGARFGGTPWARDASPYDCDAPVRGRLLIAGDAASFVDPLSSYGVKKALASGWLAAVVVHSALRDPGVEAAATALFADREAAMASGLRRQFAALAREAHEAHAAGFWDDRDGPGPFAPAADPDLPALRSDPRVRAAFDDLRSREVLHVVPGAQVARERRGHVVADVVEVDDHLMLDGFRHGVRFIRNVNLVALADLAPGHRSVPSLFEAYRARVGPAALPDVVGALAVLVGRGALRFA